MVRTHLLVVAYDISSNRRRDQLVKVLSGYGVRVNLSVFECKISSASMQTLKDTIKGLIHRNDSVLFYELCRHCETKMESLGYRCANTRGPGDGNIVV